MPRIFWGVLALLLTACASEPPPPAPTVVRLQLQATTDLNPSGSGQPAPVRVRLYELKSGAIFSRADYFSLVEAASATLGSDLVEQDELLIQPGEQLILDRTLDEQSRLLGFVVAYRDLDDSVWRQLVNIPPHQTSILNVSLSARAISAVPATPAK
ncbi:type VI secretion system lipoprotein TssJ [Ectopseudomonas hydrolytica]|uniref:Type VI secretion system lipoprotein TssJ n=1 Tax=Ectopseudomonas hydrolytica TaxID=2493633 RepID=A0ABY5ADY5_9GAMM|nr:type VI secretion system lipoprotein TssJ [Pseudomonas hydrolytica]USR41952.1 type VI secretion system lipoprotein TssJ [Pseudomonas hydrolytica]